MEKVQHLFLLVGENPLPNYVAARTLLKEGGTVYLVFTEQTSPQKDCLIELLEKKGIKCADKHIDLGNNESNACSIREEIEDAMENIDSDSVGLNYTGGTKAMAVHGYRTIIKSKPDALFSYLDPRHLKMWINEGDLAPEDYDIEVEMSLEELFNLHEKYLLTHFPPISEPPLAELSEEIARLYATKKSGKKWKNWLTNKVVYPELKPELAELLDNYLNCSNEVIKEKAKQFESALEKLFQWQKKELPENVSTQSQPPFAELSEKMDRLRETQKLQEKWNKKKKNLILFPEFKLDIKDELNQYVDWLGKSITEKAEQNGFTSFEDFIKWLQGVWLESYTLKKIQEKASELGIQKESCQMSFNVAKDRSLVDTTNKQKHSKFEFDVAFIKGYQLFAFTCTAKEGKSDCKEKLFEGYLRARELGGDEARVALVCCYESDENNKDKPNLEEEMTKFGIRNPKIKVFERKDLPDLGEKIAKWVKEVETAQKL